MLNKTDHMESLLLGLKPDFVAITETWLTADITDDEISTPNYSVVRKDRPTRGGGVAILIKNTIPFTVLPAVENVEAIFCKLEIGYQSVAVGCVYRSPSSDREVLRSLYHYIATHLKGARLILLGDFNVPDIDWQAMTFHSPNSDIVCDIMLDFNLHQLIKQPTRTQGTTSNVLDLIFISDHYSPENCKIDIFEGISDHQLTYCTIPEEGRLVFMPPPTTFPDFMNADDTSILDHLIYEYDGFEKLAAENSADIDRLWHKFKDIILFCINNYVPTKCKRPKKGNPWITRDIIHAKRKVKRLRKARKANSKQSSVNQLATAITTLKSKIKVAKSNYFTKILPSFMKSAPTKFWNYLNPKKRNDQPTSPEDNIKTANLLNNYFQSVFTVDDGNLPPIGPFNHGTIGPLTITEAGILNLLLTIDAKKSTGPDNVPNIFLKRY